MNISPKENVRLAYEHKVPFYLPSMFTDIVMFIPCLPMERYAGYETGLDGFGVEWKYEPKTHAPMTTQKHLIDSICDWQKVKFPDLDAIDWKAQAYEDTHLDMMAYMNGKGRIPFADGHSIMDTDKFILVGNINGPFERMHALEGFENALCDLIEEEEACADYFKAIADWKIKLFHKLAENYKGIDGINGQDDYGSAHDLFMPVKTWRKLIKPNLARMVEAVHSEGLIYQHHSCGYIEPLIEDFIEIGVDAIDTWQGGSNPNLGDIKKKYGDKITFCGGFDNQYVLEKPGVTEEEIRAEYRRVVDLLAPNGSFIVFPITVGFDFMQPFMDEHFKYGMGFYNKDKSVD